MLTFHLDYILKREFKKESEEEYQIKRQRQVDWYFDDSWTQYQGYWFGRDMSELWISKDIDNKILNVYVEYKEDWIR